MPRQLFITRKRRRSVSALGLWSISTLLWTLQLESTESWVLQRIHTGPFTRSGNMQLLMAKPKTKVPTGPDPNTFEKPEIPANLRRKVRAQRPALGHVVPSGSDRRSTQKASGGSSPSFLRAQGKLLNEYSATSSPTFATSRLKIAAGTARGRRLDSPNVHIRPMMGKVKEAVYSTFTSFGLYDTATSTMRHLDIFAGSGSVGLESLSRGAAHCTFVDMSSDCCACIQRNLDATGLGKDDEAEIDSRTSMSTISRARICCTDAFTALRDPLAAGIPAGTTYHLVTLCPPYEEIVYGDLLEAVVSSPLVQDDTVVLVEYPIELQCLPPAIVATCTQTGETRTAVGVRNRRYGRTVLALYVINPTGRLPPAASSRPEEFVYI